MPARINTSSFLSAGEEVELTSALEARHRGLAYNVEHYLCVTSKAQNTTERMTDGFRS